MQYVEVLQNSDGGRKRPQRLHGSSPVSFGRLVTPSKTSAFVGLQLPGLPAVPSTSGEVLLLTWSLRLAIRAEGANAKNHSQQPVVWLVDVTPPLPPSIPAVHAGTCGSCALTIDSPPSCRLSDAPEAAEPSDGFRHREIKQPQQPIKYRMKTSKHLD